MYIITRECFTEICSGSEAGSYLRLIDFVYHSTLGLRVIMERRGITRGCYACRKKRGVPGTEQVEELACIT